MGIWVSTLYDVTTRMKVMDWRDRLGRVKKDMVAMQRLLPLHAIMHALQLAGASLDHLCLFYYRSTVTSLENKKLLAGNNACIQSYTTGVVENNEKKFALYVSLHI